MKILTTILSTLPLLTGAYAQVKIDVVDFSSGKPIEGVQVQWQSLTTDQRYFSITDADGVANTSLALPLVYEVSHVSYAPVSDTLKSSYRLIKLKLSSTALDEVIVTGQFEAQSINQAVHTVKAIDRQRIEAQGAIDLADVLSNNLNITLTPNRADGRTTVSMLGLDGQYVKILVDGVPFPSVDGNGNNVDITQINLNNIERVEIVEGPMAVSYGANALAGVINLITKTSTLNSISIQEETVGPEYGLNQGRHIQSISLGHKFKNGFLIHADLQRNDFTGFRNGFQGEDHAESDEQRGYDWHPKLQYSGNASIAYDQDHFKARYRFSYFKQTLDLFSRTVFPDEHPSSGLTNPFALDGRNLTDRFAHSLNISGKLSNMSYNIVSAYTGVEMEQQTIRKRILTDTEEEITFSEENFLRSAMSRGNLTNITGSELVDFELGYEYTFENTQSANIEGGDQSLSNIAAFASMEWTPVQNITFRPGLRAIHNSLFEAPLIYSFNLKYNAPKNFDIRLSYGRSYRTPNLTELYFFFVDANHDVRGNANLNPEDGYGISMDIKKNMKMSKCIASSSLKLFYNDIQDQITLGVVNEEPLQFQYINIDRFKSQGISFSNRLMVNNWSINAGASYIGRYNAFSEEHSNLNEFLFSPEVNFNTTYSLQQPGLSFALLYKHTGRVEQYVLDADSGSFRKGKTNAFNWLDITSTWKATDNLTVQGGAKNLLDITDIDTTAGSSAGAHTGTAQSVALTYGRSYFLRLTYNF